MRRASRCGEPRPTGLTLALLLCCALGCSADAVDAPHVAPPGAAGPCGTLATFTAATRQALDGGLLDPIGRQLKRVLVDSGQYRALTAVLISLIRQAPPHDLFEALRAMAEADTLGTLTPLYFELVDYITGHSAVGVGEHYQLPRLEQAVLTYCSLPAWLATLRRLVEFQALCADCPGGVEPFVPALLRAISELVDDPVYRAQLESMQIQQDGQLAVGRDAFVLLIGVVVDDVAAPTFDWSYVRSQLDDALGRRLTGTTRERFDALVDLIGSALDPAAGLLPDLQVALGCLNRNDQEHAIAGMIYDFAVSEQYRVATTLGAAADAYDQPGGQQLLGYVARVFGLLEREPRLASDLATAVAPLFGEQASREVLPALSELRGQGVAHELLGNLGRFLTECNRTAGE